MFHAVKTLRCCCTELNMRSSRLVLQHLLPLDSVVLGRLVTNAENPAQGYYHSPQLQTFEEPKDITVSAVTKYKDSHKQETSSSVNAAVAKVFKLAFLGEGDQMTTLETARVRTYLLQNSDEKWDTLVKEEEARKWFEKTMRKSSNVYFVVGFQTVFSATMHADGSSKAAAEGAAKAPIPKTNTDVKLAGSKSKKESGGVDFVAEHEQIYAVQYRKVRFDFLSSKDMDHASLELGNRWKVLWKVRGQSTGEDDVIEVRLEDPTFEAPYSSKIQEDDGQVVYFIAQS
jgi:hypothetical protein